MCAALRAFHSRGKEIIQVEPYLENLLALHDFLADGGTPNGLDRNTISFLVHLAEKKATDALISYYQASVNASFDLTIEAVKNFAQADSARFRLRDSLRAQELTALIPSYTSSFVEAGMMHFPLRRLLKKQLSEDSQVQSVFLTDKIFQEKGKRRHLYSPGDQLTFLYIFAPEFNDKDREYLLSARALIYSKIICKEELSPDTESYPHLLDELLCIDVTRKLSVDDCYQLFSRIRGAGTFDSRQIVADHLVRSRPQISERLKRWMLQPSNNEGTNNDEAHLF